MVLACTDELHEIMRENSWKPWHRGRDGYGELLPATPATEFLPDGGGSRDVTDEYRKRVVEDEFGDVMCFLGNIARVHGLSTDDIIAGHSRKLELNAVRHADQAEALPVESS